MQINADCTEHFVVRCCAFRGLVGRLSPRTSDISSGPIQQSLTRFRFPGASGREAGEAFQKTGKMLANIPVGGTYTVKLPSSQGQSDSRSIPTRGIRLALCATRTGRVFFRTLHGSEHGGCRGCRAAGQHDDVALLRSVRVGNEFSELGFSGRQECGFESPQEVPARSTRVQ